MNDPVIAALTRRIYDLEQQRTDEEQSASTPPAKQTAQQPASPKPRQSAPKKGAEPPRDAPPPPPADPPPPPAPPPPPPPPADPNAYVIEEANLVGTWLARIGALAILAGAGFGFKYGVDRGVIGPALRVFIGLGVSAALVAWSELTRRKGWNAFSQAIAGGGVALAYLSTLVAFQLYGLVSGPVAFTGLVGITIAGGILAAVHRSPALTLLSLAGAYLNPFLAWHGGHMQPFEALLYIVAVNAVILFLARYRWPIIEIAAFVGTVIVFTVVSPQLRFGEGILFSTIFLAELVAPPFLRRARARIDEAIIPIAASGLYFGYVEHLLATTHPSWDGWFSLILATALGGLAFVSLRLKDDEVLATGMFAPAVLFFLAFPPLEFRSPAILTAWAVQGAAVYAAGRYLKTGYASTGGLVLMHLALLGSFNQLADYRADHILFSTASAPIVATIAAFAVGAIAGIRTKHRVEAVSIGSVLAGEATLLSLGWLSVEAVVAIHRLVSPASQIEVIGFTLSALWTMFSAITLAIGVGYGVRWARYGAAMLLLIVVVKLGLYDAWLLHAGYRIAAFIGVGCVLLACSVMYQRLRQLILEGSGSGVRKPAA